MAVDLDKGLKRAFDVPCLHSLYRAERVVAGMCGGIF